MDRAKKAISVVRLLERSYPIHWFKSADPFHVLISTVLSQRTKDANTDKASAALFRRYRTPQQIAGADLESVQRLIKAAGFYRQKARNIKKISQLLLEKYGGKVPRTFDELLALPGVGRKTAGCVLVYGYRIPAIPVDVHVHVISNRLGLVRTRTPERTEQELMAIVPKRYWIRLNELFVRHGQDTCKARPLCETCALKDLCDYYRNRKFERKAEFERKTGARR